MNQSTLEIAKPRPGARPRRRTRFTLAQLALGLLVLGVLARVVRYALNFPLWGDEAFVAIDFLTRDYAAMLRPLTYAQIVPLFFMWGTLAASKLLGNSEYVLRLLPFVAGIVALPLLWRFAARNVGRGATLLAVGFLAGAYYPIRHATEVKPYSTDLLVALVLMMLGWSVYERPRSIVRWLALIAATALAVWCSYPAVFVAGGVGLLLICVLYKLGRANPRALALGALFSIAFGVALAASFWRMYSVYGHPHADAASKTKDIPMWTEAFPPLTQPGKLLLWTVTTHTGLLVAYPNGGKNGGSIFTFLCIVLGGVHLWRTNRPLLLLLLGPLPFNFIAAALEKYPYGQTARVSLYMAPAFCLLAGVGLAAALHWLVPRGRRVLAFQIAAGALGAFAVGSMVADLIQPYKKKANYACRNVLRELAGRTQPADRWIMFNSLEPVPYAPYIASWKGDGAQFIYYSTRYSPAPIFWSPPPQEIEPHAGGQTWLLVYRGLNFKLFSPEQCAEYVATVTRTLGEPARETFVLQTRAGHEVQAIDAYKFAPRH